MHLGITHKRLYRKISHCLRAIYNTFLWKIELVCITWSFVEPNPKPHPTLVPPTKHPEGPGWWSVDRFASLFTRVSRTADLMRTKSIIDLWLKAVWYQVQLISTTVCQNMVLWPIHIKYRSTITKHHSGSDQAGCTSISPSLPVWTWRGTPMAPS